MIKCATKDLFLSQWINNAQVIDLQTILKTIFHFATNNFGSFNIGNYCLSF